MRVALFVTCLADSLAPQAGQATVAVLERLGHEVVFPEEQTCCGQMHANGGYPQEAAALARRFLRVFGDDSLDAVVSPSSSCVTMVRHGYRSLGRELGDEALADGLRDLSAGVYELSEFLVDRLGVVDVGARFPHRVAYHPSCHGLRSLRLGDRPLALLRAVGGLELAELAEADVCCGFGGTFAVKNPETSTAMLSDKLERIRASGAEVCVATDSSCLLQIGGGFSRARSPVRTMHLAEVLAAR